MNAEGHEDELRGWYCCLGPQGVVPKCNEKILRRLPGTIPAGFDLIHIGII
jgi:hypothetical protein